MQRSIPVQARVCFERLAFPTSEPIHRSQRNESEDVVCNLRLAVGDSRRHVPFALAGVVYHCKRVQDIRKEYGL